MNENFDGEDKNSQNDVPSSNSFRNKDKFLGKDLENEVVKC